MARILIIDDDAAIAMSLCAFLEDYGFETASAVSSEEAETMLLQEKFDMALVDMRMPGENGDVFIVKAKQKYPHMSFMIHTGSAHYQLSGEMKDLGFSPDSIIRKPMRDLSLLADAISKRLL
ncbi:MAG: response regulator [Gammaproteobacteria bacterium]|nr:response regulator [Gammaproteobacteria bacterium]